MPQKKKPTAPAGPAARIEPVGAPNRFKAVETLADRAYLALEELIMTADLPTNALVSESQLAADLQIGRTPVREALKRLEADGLVDIVASRGIFITEVDLQQQLMVLEVRRELERLVAIRAARHATPPERERFLELAKRMHNAAGAGDGELFMRCDQEFNLLLDRASRNPIATKSLRPLRSMSRRFWFQNFMRESDSLDLGATTHTAVMRAVAAGDVVETAKAMDELMDYVIDFAHSTLHDFN